MWKSNIKSSLIFPEIYSSSGCANEAIQGIDEHTLIIYSTSSLEKLNSYLGIDFLEMVQIYNCFSISVGPLTEERVSECVDRIDKAVPGRGLNRILAIGSGSCADWAKLLGSYFDFPTELLSSSISTNASMVFKVAIWRGKTKYSINSRPCQKIYFDPIYLAFSFDQCIAGFGDILSCYTALLDWRLAIAGNHDSYIFQEVCTGEDRENYQRCFMETEATVRKLESVAATFPKASQEEIILACIDLLTNVSILVNEISSIHPNMAGRIDAGCEHQFAFAIEAGLGTPGMLHGHLVALSTIVMMIIYDLNPPETLDKKIGLSAFIELVRAVGLLGPCQDIFQQISKEAFVEMFLHTTPRVGRWTLIDSLMDLPTDVRRFLAELAYQKTKILLEL